MMRGIRDSATVIRATSTSSSKNQCVPFGLLTIKLFSHLTNAGVRRRKNYGFVFYAKLRFFSVTSPPAWRSKIEVCDCGVAASR